MWSKGVVTEGNFGLVVRISRGRDQKKKVYFDDDGEIRIRHIFCENSNELAYCVRFFFNPSEGGVVNLRETYHENDSILKDPLKKALLQTRKEKTMIPEDLLQEWVEEYIVEIMMAGQANFDLALEKAPVDFFKQYPEYLVDEESFTIVHDVTKTFIETIVTK